VATLITFFAANKLLLPAIGLLLGAIAVYFKGYTSGSDSVRQKNEEAMNRIQQDLQKVAAKNQSENTKREQDANAVNGADSIAELISMWNKLDKKAPDSSTDKGK
jgi:hypothetical protein